MLKFDQHISHFTSIYRKSGVLFIKKTSKVIKIMFTFNSI